MQIQDQPLKIVDNHLRFRPEVTFDKTGVRSSYDDGSSTFFAWEDICKIELLSVTQQGSRRGRFFLFWGPEDKTVLVPYDQAPLVTVQESRWLPGFNIQKLMSCPTHSAPTVTSGPPSGNAHRMLPLLVTSAVAGH
jgi:hypothetical protein